MESTVEAKWKRDPDHTDRPDWATTRTPKGWSDSEHRNSRGEASLKGLEERLGDGSVLTSQPTIPIWLTREQKETIDKASPKELKKLASYTKNQMRVDALLESPELKIPIYIEIDGRQHERNSAYKGISQSHLDRIKDFCSRLNQGALMIRVKSDADASKKVERIYGELKRYGAILEEFELEDRNARREHLQAYADALCYGATEGRWPEKTERPMGYMNRILDGIASSGQLRLSPEQVKLLNIWVRRRNDLKGFARAFRALEGENGLHVQTRYSGRYYRPYRFVEELLWRVYHQRPGGRPGLD